jgi:very-short-patch-repair endonuclease
LSLSLHACRDVSLALLPRSRRGARETAPHHPPPHLPVTTIQRTVDDLDGTGPPHLFRRAKRQAELKGIQLEGSEHRRARSDLEEDFFALVHRHRLPSPETNVKIGRHEVDFLWREQRLVIETDSYLYHRGSVSFEDDHVRDLDRRSAGYTVLRFTDKNK